MNSFGFNEIMCNSLTTSEYVKLSNLLSEDENVTMLNPLSSDLETMRQSLIFSGLEAVSYNINRRNMDLKFFEFGKTYHKNENKFNEIKHLSVFETGNRTQETWTNAQKPSDFFYFKGHIQSVFDRLGINKTKNQPVVNDVFAEGIAFAVGTDVLVEFGTIKKSILKNFDIKQEVFYADFNWSAILKLIQNKIKFVEIPKYPEVRRHLSLLLNDDVTFENIYKVARLSEKTLLKEIDLFDVYQDKNMPEGKKSYAVSFIIQDITKTLEDEQIDRVMKKIQKNLETELQASLR